MDDVSPMRVPLGQVFVLNDFRGKSPIEDSSKKSWSLVPVGAIKGKAVCTWLSIDPEPESAKLSLFSRIRFERMFKKIP